MSLCQFKDVFGKPGTGAHAWKIANTPVVDFVATVALAYVVRQIWWPETELCKVLLICLVIGEVFHYAFCVPTAWQVSLGLQK